MAKFYNEYKSKNLLRAYDIPTGEYELARTRDEAAEIGERFEYPLDLQIVSDQIIHKTEAKGIKLNVSGREEVSAAFDELVQNGKNYDKDAVIEGVLVSKMVPQGVEVIIGGIRDVQFGPVIMFGLGGIFVEIFKDVQFRMAPLDKTEALKLIRSIKAFPMLDGARGKEPVNLDALADLIVKTAQYIYENENVKEIDLNPVICYGNKVQALDAAIGVE